MELRLLVVFVRKKKVNNMRNKKKKKQGLITIDLDKASKVLWIVTMALGVLVSLLIFAPCLVSQTGDIHTGLQITFGEKWFDVEFAREYVPFHFLTFLGYFLPLLAAGLMFYNYKKENKWFDLIVSVMFLLSFIFIILIPQYAHFVKETPILDTVTKPLIEGKLGWGSQIAGASSFLGIISGLLKCFSDTYGK